GSFSGGLRVPEADFVLIAHGQKTAGTKRRYRAKAENAFHSLDELHKGDYIVHNIHGIGIFSGIESLAVQGVTKDYIKIKYAKGDALYVPVTQLDLVSKYIGPRDDAKTIKLNRLGGKEWEKAKERVRGAVGDMAKELTELYAKRLATPGYAFSPDIDMQSDFERRFEYDETEDQLRCISEIKRDMERPVPMDRLLCGDVGFGKTEVALRAAFKCIAEGKQCAVLVPTTILAFQHYNTILKRFDGFPFEIEMLSRFRTPAQQRKTVQNIKAGYTDIVVGTHRLISKDVEFRDLGLLIVDEEQRFGVAQKEKLKEKFPNVDVLTLSATPIPRTLNMAMTGIRDMSIIEEAPSDRHPVQTHVLEYDPGIIAQAIEKELRRGGQVYYMHNNVETITHCAARIHELVPEARIGIGHGKMSEDELSEVWRRLVEGEIDVLVCTTIIETGVDVPNANTLIIENSDRLGLAQLHQIRGRIGRSPRRATAYFTFYGGKELTETAYRRLTAIREYTEFGSGFKIAMRDLELRGAGSLLGARQHGHMEAVGYDMYLKILGDAVAELRGEQKGEPVKAEPECLIDIQIDAHIPESYISSVPQRLSAYRRIADVRTEDDASDVTDELTDRFGDPPQAVLGLIEVSLLRNIAAHVGVYEIGQSGNRLLLYWNRIDMRAVG
ncbi:MAG: transcription-repair coupling factor, partial [Clostridia bacterium]|nr:transcription-repair coupling factor [Clostridia bacterium]